MDMTGEQRIPNTQDAVWAALNDLETLKACIPGCESIETVGDNEHQVTVAAAVGPVKARFKGKINLTDLQPPDAYRIRFEGQGGAAGFAKGEAEVKLQADGSHTLMKYHVHAQVGGKIAQVGSRLVDAAAKKVADDFFKTFNARVAAPEPEPVTEGPADGALAASAAPAAAQAPAGGGVPAWAWLVGAAVLALVAWYASH